MKLIKTIIEKRFLILFFVSLFFLLSLTFYLITSKKEIMQSSCRKCSFKFCNYQLYKNEKDSLCFDITADEIFYDYIVDKECIVKFHDKNFIYNFNINKTNNKKIKQITELNKRDLISFFVLDYCKLCKYEIENKTIYFKDFFINEFNDNCLREILIK